MSSATNHNNRRMHDRFAVQPGYTPVRLRHLDSDKFTLEGHAYDISVGGVMFELDRAIDAGTAISMQIEIPPTSSDVGPGRAVFAFGNVVWVDESEPGPIRMAVAFTRFARAGDEQRLHKALANNRMAKAA